MRENSLRLTHSPLKSFQNTPFGYKNSKNRNNSFLFYIYLHFLHNKEKNIADMPGSRDVASPIHKLTFSRGAIDIKM